MGFEEDIRAALDRRQADFDRKDSAAKSPTTPGTPMGSGTPMEKGQQYLATGPSLKSTFPSSHVMDFRELLVEYLKSLGYRCDTGGGMGVANIWAKKDDGMPEIYLTLMESGLSQRASILSDQN